MEKFLYLGILLVALSYPLAQSFEHRIRYASKWKFWLPGMLITALFFLIWDLWFTQMGVWSFNPRYHLGLLILNIPLEEVLFFLIVPFACLFIYEVLIYFFPSNPLQGLGKPFFFLMIPTLLVLGLWHLDKWYTAVNFLIGSAVLLVHYRLYKEQFLGKFLFAYLVHLIPFFLCNGILTGGLTPEPVVSYNDAENLGIRIGTVPIEDAVYSMTLLLMNVSFFEALRSKKQFSPGNVKKL